MAASDFELDDTLFAAPASKTKPDAAPAPDMELDDNLFASPTPPRKDEPGFFGNTGRAFAAGAIGATADAVQGGQDMGVLAAGTDLNPQDRANAGAVDGVRDTLRSTADSLVDGMSESAKRALAAKLWGADRSKGERNVWDSDVSLKEALTTKMAQGLGSLVPSMGAALLGGIPGGSTAAGAMGAGGFTKDLRDLFGKMSDDDLRQNIPEFSEYLDAGIAPKEAREMLIQGAIGNKAVYQFLASGALATVGVEGMIGAGTLGRGGLGRAIGRAAKGEAVNEFLDQGTQEASKRLAIRDYEQRNSLPLSDPDISGALEASVQAGILGGLTGGTVGGVGHVAGGRHKEVEAGQRDGATVGAVDPDTAAGLETANENAATAPTPDMTAPEVSQPPAQAAPAPAPVEDPAQQNAPPAAPDAVLDEDPDAEPMVATPAPEPATDPLAAIIEPTPEVTAPASDDVTAQLDNTEASLADIGAQIENLVTPVVEQPREQVTTSPSTTERIDAVGRQLDELKTDLQAPQTATSEAPRGPRVLRSLEDEAAEKKANQLNRARVSAPEAARVVRGENTAAKLTSDPDQLGSREDRQAIKRIIDRAIAGGVTPEQMTENWRTMSELRGPLKKDQRDAWMAARRAVHDETVSQVYSGEAVTEDAQAVATRQERERRAQTERTAADITGEMPLVTGRAIGDGKGTLAVIDSMMALAQERGIDLSGRTDDRGATVFLRDAQALGNDLRAGKNVSMERLVQFAADAAAVKEDPAAFMASRRATSDEAARAAGIERNVSIDANEGVANAVAATPDDRQVESTTVRRKVTPKPVAAPEQDNSTVTAGEDKAGKFAVASKRRRPVAPASQAQAEAGNYPKGHRKFMGHDVTVETARGQKRRGPGWEATMPVDYGYIKRTTGADGDQVDVFLGPSQLAKQIFMINQQNLDGSFDEHKVMMGFPSEEAARTAYENSFSDGRGADRIQSIVPMSRAEFSEWLKGDTVSAFNPDMATTLEEPAAEPPRIRASMSSSPTVAGWSQLINKWAGRGRERTSAQIRALAMGATTGRDMLARAATADNGPIFNAVSRQLGPILDRIAGHVPVYVLSPEAMVALTVDDTIIRNGWTAAPEGFYSRDEHGRQYVALRSDMLDGGEGQTRLVLHEMLHAAVHDTIENNPVEMARIQNMLDVVKQQLPADYNVYGLSNVHEFISEAFSNSEFQELLRVTPATAGLSVQLNPNRSMWSEFVASMSRLVDSMLQFIGVRSAPSRNMLEMAMLQGERLLDISERRPPLYSLRQGAASPLAPRMSMEQVTDRGNTLTTKARRVMTRLMTLDQLRQSGEGLFTREGTDWLNRAVTGMLQIDQTAEKYAKDGADLTQKYVEAIRNHRDRMADYGDLAVDVTSMDVKMLNDPRWTRETLLEHNKHLSQTAAGARQKLAQLEGLQKRFMAMPAELRALWMDSQQFFTKTRIDTARAVGQSVLQERKGLTAQQRDGLVNRALAGTLDEADKTLLGPTIFNDLAKARLIKGTDGDYFPLMRRGEHVVVTHLNRGDLKGGKEVEPGVVEFKAADDKAARALFNQFADSTGLPITSVRRRYYLRETGEPVSAADAAGHDVDVAYRAYVQTQGVQFFESMNDAQEFARAAKASNEYTSVSEVLQRKDWYSQDDLSSSQLTSLLGAVARRTDMGEQQKAEMRIAIYEAAARMMSGTRVQQRSIARRMVKGASADMARAVHDYTSAASGYIARMEHMPAVREAMGEMRKVQQEELMGAGRQRGSEILNELSSRTAVNDGNVTPPGKALRDLMTLTFMARLFSPAYSLINAMQVAMVAYPTLAGRFGELKSAGAINRAYMDMGAGGVIARGVTNTASAVKAWSNDTFNGADPLASARAALAKREDGKALLKVLDELEAVGLVGNDSGMEVAHASLRGRGAWGTNLARMDRIGRQLPTAVEVMNRVVTAVATYRLAVNSGMNAEQATAHARDMVANTQGDYSARNAPPIFNTTLGRLSLQFKKYGQMMYYLIGRMAHDAFKGATPQERAVGRRQLLNLAAVQLAMAGAFSLPGLEIIKFVGIISGMLGFGDDDDAKKWLTKVMADSIGKTPAELISKGVLSRAVGVDLSQRLSLSDMILFGEPENYDRGSMESYILRLLTGAGPGFIGDWYTGYKNAADGEWQKAFERFVPAKIAADTSRASRAYFADEINEAEAFVKAMGLQPATLANKNEKTGERVKAQRQLPAERKALEKKFLRADRADERGVMKEIAEFNERAGFRNKIFPKQLAARKKMGETAYRKMMDEKNRQREEQD